MAKTAHRDSHRVTEMPRIPNRQIRRRGRKHKSFRRLLFEPLEDRRVLSTTFSLIYHADRDLSLSDFRDLLAAGAGQNSPDNQVPGDGWRYWRSDLTGTNHQPSGTTVDTLLRLQLERTLGNGPAFSLTGDVDSDGKRELVRAEGTVLQIFEANGQLQTSISMPHRGELTMLDDVNGDGTLEIGISGWDNNTAYVYLYDGSGNLLQTMSRPRGWQGYVRPIGVIKPQVILAAAHADGCTPRGLFAYDVTTGREVWHYDFGRNDSLLTSLADIDADGRLEATVGWVTVHNACSANQTTDGELYLTITDDDGSNLLTQVYPPPNDGSAYHIFRDVNKDGTYEIIGIERHELPYSGRDRVIVYDLNGHEIAAYTGPWNEKSSWAVADVDGDGWDNVVVGGYSEVAILDEHLQVIHRRADNGFVQLVSDLTGDRQLDIVTLTQSGVLRVYDNELNLISSIQFPTSVTPNYIMADDIDSDGVVEVLVRSFYGTYVVGFEAAPQRQPEIDLTVVRDQVTDEGSLLTVEDIGTFLLSGLPQSAPIHAQYTIDWGDGTDPDVGTADIDSTDPQTGVATGSFDGAHIYRQSGQFQVTITVTAGDAAADTKSFLVFVRNVAPTVTVDKQAISVDEGQRAVNSGTVFDPGEDTVALSASVGSVALNPGGNWTWAYDALDGPDGSQQVVITAVDSDGGMSSTTFDLTVHNVAPRITGLASNHADPCDSSTDGQVVIRGAIADPAGPHDAYLTIVDWGDGTIRDTIAIDPVTMEFSAKHKYTTGGIFVISVVGWDDDGAASPVANVPAAVQGVGLVGRTLYIVGTDGRDHVNVKSHDKGKVEVDAKWDQDGKQKDERRRHSKVTYDVTAIDRIVSYLCDGNDHYNGNVGFGGSEKKSEDDRIDGLPMGQIVLGGDGNDHLQGGRGHDLLIGGRGDDVIHAGGGRDIAIGGQGRDDLKGGDGDDLLIGGAIGNSLGLASLEKALADWSRGDTASAILDLGSILDDGEEDHLHGDKGDDTIMGGVGDKIKS